MDFKTFLNHVLSDTKVKLTEAFDRNFERKGFFNQKWPETKIPNQTLPFAVPVSVSSRTLVQ